MASSLQRKITSTDQQILTLLLSEFEQVRMMSSLQRKISSTKQQILTLLWSELGASKAAHYDFPEEKHLNYTADPHLAVE